MVGVRGNKVNRYPLLYCIELNFLCFDFGLWVHDLEAANQTDRNWSCSQRLCRFHGHQVFDILPIYGKLEPGETQVATFTCVWEWKMWGRLANHYTDTVSFRSWMFQSKYQSLKEMKAGSFHRSGRFWVWKSQDHHLTWVVGFVKTLQDYPPEH